MFCILHTWVIAEGATESRAGLNPRPRSVREEYSATRESFTHATSTVRDSGFALAPTVPCKFSFEFYMRGIFDPIVEIYPMGTAVIRSASLFLGVLTRLLTGVATM
jgi:hypothetical protein